MTPTRPEGGRCWKNSCALEYKMKKGRFSIIESDRFNHHQMFHQCHYFRPYIQRVIARRYSNGVVWSCADCHKAPPVGLVGAYLLLEMDDAQRQIDEASPHMRRPGMGPKP